LAPFSDWTESAFGNNDNRNLWNPEAAIPAAPVEKHPKK
jgi:hypothetical protein